GRGEWSGGGEKGSRTCRSGIDRHDARSWGVVVSRIRNSRLKKLEAESRRRFRQLEKETRNAMSKVAKDQAEKQSAKSASKQSAAANVRPRQVKRTAPVAPSAQTSAKPPAAAKPSVAQPKPLAKLMSTTALDGFSGFNDAIEGDDRPQGGGIIQGRLIKFTNPGCIFVTADDEIKVSADLELIPIDIIRVVQKWIDGMPVETIIVAPGEKFPDIKAMNEEAPQSEWREYSGEMVGPWQMQYLVYLLNAQTLDKF